MNKTRLKHNNLYNSIIALIMVVCGMLFIAPAWADGCKPTKCPTTCSSTSANCGQKMDANCVANQNKNVEGGSCFNNVPITATDSVASQCSSAGGERGTNFAVSNASKDNPAYVKAAAAGKVRYAGLSKDGGGRMVIIEHTKSCEDSAHGDSGTYTTTYRHLLSYNVSVGNIVNVNDIIGIAGGSTSTESGKICDNKSQAGTPDYKDDGCSGISPNDIYLNFEIKDGPYTQTDAASASGLNSNCNEMQNFCGGCSSDLSTCLSQNPAEYREVVAASTSADYYSKNAHAASTKAACDDGMYIDPENCVFCGLFKDIFNAASSIAKIANKGLAIPTRNLVGIGFLIWLAIFVLRNVSSFSGAKISDIMKAILFQGFRVTLVMLILGGAIYQVMDLTINPVMQTGLSFARMVSNGESSTCSADAEYLQGVVGYDSEKGYQESDSGGLSKQLGIAYLCSVKKIEDGVSKLMTYGSYSTCLSFRDFPSLGFVPHAGFLTTGIFLYAVGAVMMIMFPWFLIDCLLQLCIVVALLPCAIGAFAFKITAKYLKNLWQFFMNSMFMFVFVSIVVFIITANFKTWLGYDFDTNEIDPNIFINATGNGLAWWGISAFRVLGVAFFCFIFLSEAKEMAGKFANAPTLGGGKGIGTMFGGLAASAGFSAAKAGAHGAGKVGGKIGGALEESVLSLMGAETRSVTNHARGIMLGALGGEKIKDKDGNTIGYRRSGKFFGKNYTTEYRKDDKGIWSSRAASGKNETIDDTILKAKLTKNENGDVVGITTSAKPVSMNYLINKDKTINQNAVTQLMSNTGNKEYAARHIVGEVMKDRGMQLDDKFLSSETKINDDGSYTIVQKNEDGKIQTINASIDANTGIMTIKSDIDDGSGNITSTISDGITPKKQITSKATDKTKSGATATALNNGKPATTVSGAAKETPSPLLQNHEASSEIPAEGVSVSRTYNDLRGVNANTLSKLSQEELAQVKENSSYSDTYKDNYGNIITVHRAADGDVARIETLTADGKIYHTNRAEFNEERLEALSQRLQNSPKNLNDITKDLSAENQEYQQWEQAGKPALKAEQGSLIQKVRKDSERYSHETLIDSNGDRMIIERREGKITEISIRSLDGKRTTIDTNKQNRDQMQEELESYVSRLKNYPNDLSVIQAEINDKYPEK